MKNVIVKEMTDVWNVELCREEDIEIANKFATILNPSRETEMNVVDYILLTIENVDNIQDITDQQLIDDFNIYLDEI